MPTKEQIIQKLKEKAESGYSSGVRMPSIKQIHQLLDECGIKHTFSTSYNTVEYRSAGRTYVNSRYRGKEGYEIVIHLDENQSKLLHRHVLSMDTSDSYYSHNSRHYAADILKLVGAK